MVVLTLKEDKIISLYPFVLDPAAMITDRSFMRLFSWPEELRRKALLGRCRPSIWLIGRMAKVTLRLRSPYFFVDILITWSLGSLQISLQGVTSTFIVLLGVPLSLMLKVLMLVYSSGSCTMLNSLFQLPKRKVPSALTSVALVYVPLTPLYSPSVCRLAHCSLPSYPVQIKSKELKSLLTSPIKESAIVIWLQQKISGFNFQIVTCVDEEQHVDEYLQFRISTAIPGSFPNHYTVNGVNFRIDHALPYAMPISSGVRPPTAQSVHDHWKSSVKRTPMTGKDMPMRWRKLKIALAQCCDVLDSVK